MTGNQVAALVVAIYLLLPGGCFLAFGIDFPTDQRPTDPLILMFAASLKNLAGSWDVSLVMFLVAAAILSLAAFLFWVAFRRKRPAQGGSPNAPPP